jgi:hypothetical protein
MKSNLIILSLLLVSILSFAQNKIETNANISGVTVYSSSAEIKYKKEINLKKGKNTIIFSDLTPFIVDNSINVSFSDKSINIITVTEKINYLKETKNTRIAVIKDSIEHNNERIELISYQTEALNKEKELLFKDKGIGGVANGVSVSEIEKASVFFNNRYTQINNELFKLKKQKTKLEKTNKNLNLQINEVATTNNKNISEITIVVNSPKNKKVSVNFNLLTYNAGWAPLYDIKYFGPDKNLQFIFRANVFNASNTDWEDVNITLSTASPTIGFSLPSLNKNRPRNKSQINYQNENIEFKTIETNNAITEYKIKHKYSIPSDGKPYLVEVNELEMKSEFSYIIIPKLDNNGFLMANIPNWNKYNIISGTTNIYNNGTFLGKTFLNTITTNDTLEVYLGKDNKIETYRKEISNEHPRNFIGNYFVDKTNVIFTIKNNYDKKVRIKLIDQVPVFSGRDKVKMAISGIENAIYKKSDGSITWNFSLNPKENSDRKFGYTIKAPKENSEIVSVKKRKFRSIACPSF